MKCHEICQQMPDLAAGLHVATSEITDHLNSCADCTRKLEQLRQTMALLDEWQVPEPSPYFDVRLMARVREERAKPAAWLSWLRKPALAASLAVLMVMSVTLFRTDAGLNNQGNDSGTVAMAPPGTAVGDLQALDKNSELYSDFELLDDMAVQEDVNANP
jgi:predicted anti-sigma-YlaC factor YlaD